MLVQFAGIGEREAGAVRDQPGIAERIDIDISISVNGSTIDGGSVAVSIDDTDECVANFNCGDDAPLTFLGHVAGDLAAKFHLIIALNGPLLLPCTLGDNSKVCGIELVNRTCISQ